MKKTIFVMLCAAAVQVFAANPKYVFLFIGDGMSVPQRMTAEEFSRAAGTGPLAMNAMPYTATTRIPRKFGLDPLEDVQVLTPMRRNLLGTENLNFELQKALNPNGPAIVRGGTTFRVGDRVMQLRNNYDKDVYNGDVGFVKAVDAETRSLVVLFDGRPVRYEPGDLDELVLAYATTIHK